MTNFFTTLAALYLPFCATRKVIVHEPFDLTAIDVFALFSKQAPDTDHVFRPVDGVLTRVFNVTEVDATNQVFFHVVFAIDCADTKFTASMVTSKNDVTNPTHLRRSGLGSFLLLILPLGASTTYLTYP